MTNFTSSEENGWELFFKPTRLQWGGPETHREPSLSVRMRTLSRLDLEWTDSVSACLVRLLKLSPCAVATMPVSIEQIAQSLCATSRQTDAGVIFQDCESKQEMPAKAFCFCKMLLIFFVTKTLKSCWLKICTSQNAATFEALVPALTGKQWVSPWKAATAQHFGSFSSFYKFGHKKTFSAFFLSQKVRISKISEHFYYTGDPLSTGIHLSGGKVVALSTTIGFQWTFLPNCNQQIG